MVEGLVEPTAAMKVIVSKIANGEVKTNNLTTVASSFNSSNKKRASRPSVKRSNTWSNTVPSSTPSYEELQTPPARGNRKFTHVSIALKHMSSFTQDPSQQSGSRQNRVKRPKNVDPRRHADPGQKGRFSNTSAHTGAQRRPRTDSRSMSTPIHHYTPPQRHSAPVNRILPEYKTDWSRESSFRLNSIEDEGNVVTTADLADAKRKRYPPSYGFGRGEPRPVCSLRREYKQADWEVQEVLMAADILMGMQRTR